MTVVRIKPLLGLLVFLVLVAGCSTSGGYRESRLPVRQAHSSDLVSDRAVLDRLESHFNQWRGTPYRYGGLNRNGVDCSGFIYRTFADQFDLELPRTTELQSSAGRSIPANSLKPGDLVFFRTGYKDRHTGVYMGNGEFIHASSSRGVMRSSLDNPYWDRSFYMARRVLE